MSTDANALGPDPARRHLRGLDGIRALSVLAIIAFHTGLQSVPGGFYGVDAFFVLSGFLITSLLLREWEVSGSIELRRFWTRRARRLLPALFAMVAAVGLVTAVRPDLLSTPHFLSDAAAAVFFVSNWFSMQGGTTYFSLTAQPSPLLHTWSLAIEEQFYLVWPLVVLAVLTRRFGFALSRRRRLHVLFVVACLGALASALAMACLAPHGYTSRAYYGTDTRAQALLVGAAIAIGLTLWREGSRRRWFTRVSALLALLGMAATGWLWATTGEMTTFAFRGGFLVASVAAGAVVLGAVSAPRALAVRLLELPPLPQWGRISYGVYLWYWPVLLVMSGARLHWGVYPLFLARVGIAVVIAALSYDLIEMPVRRGALRRWRSWVAAPIGAAIALGAASASTLVPAGAGVLPGAADSPGDGPASTVAVSSSSPTTAPVPATGGTRTATRSGTSGTTSTTGTTGTSGTTSTTGTTGTTGTTSTTSPPPPGATPRFGPTPASTSTSTTTTTPTTSATSPTSPTQTKGPTSTTRTTGPTGPTTTTTTAAAGATQSTTTTTAPSHLAPALPARTTSKPVKVLLVGDSIAGSLGVGLAKEAVPEHVQLVNAAEPGCSLSMQSQIKVLGYTLSPGAPCDAGNNPDALFDTWRRWIDAWNPDVVVYVARGETFDQELGGQWDNLGAASFDRYVAQRFRQAVSVLGSRGATVVLLTTPYYDSGVSPSGSSWPEDNPRRVRIDNATIRAVAENERTGSTPTADNPVYVYDLNAVMSPDQAYSTSYGRVNLRCGDGVHISPSGGAFVGLQLMPDLAVLGQSHAAASPGGTWPGRLPPSTPSWYGSLPCQ